MLRGGASPLLSPVPAFGKKIAHDIEERNTIKDLKCSGSGLTPRGVVAPDDTSESSCPGALDQRVTDMVEAFKRFYSNWIVDYTQTVRYSLLTAIAQF